MAESAVVNASPLICLSRAGLVSLGIRLRGTVGLVLRGRRAGLIESARAALDRLRSSGMYLSERICAEVLKEVGE
jgi:predicted nucleic acid-binding protein